MDETIGISLKSLLQDTYQVLQERFEDRQSTQEQPDSEQLYLHMNNVSGFLEGGSVYVLSGCAPIKNKEAVRNLTCNIIKSHESDIKALAFLLKKEIQGWMLQMLSKYSSVPMSRLQLGALTTEDWRGLAAEAVEMNEEDIRVDAVVDKDELFRDADCFLKEGKLCDYIFIDSMYMTNENIVKLKNWL